MKNRNNFKVALYTNLFGILDDVSKEMIWGSFMLENRNDLS